MTSRISSNRATAYWWGIASFFRCPVDPDPANCDVAVVGVPHSSGNGSTERDQHLGPRAVRNVSGQNRRIHKQFGFSPWEAVRINDLGDVVVPEAMDNEATIDRIINRFREIAAAGTRPVSIGGDHSIAGAILTGLGGSPLTGGRPPAVLQVDAHTDTYDQLGHWLGVKRSAAHWAAYTVRNGSVDASRSVQRTCRVEHSRTPTASYAWPEVETVGGLTVQMLTPISTTAGCSTIASEHWSVW